MQATCKTLNDRLCPHLQILDLHDDDASMNVRRDEANRSAEFELDMIHNFLPLLRPSWLKESFLATRECNLRQKCLLPRLCNSTERDGAMWEQPVIEYRRSMHWNALQAMLLLWRLKTSV